MQMTFEECCKALGLNLIEQVDFAQETADAIARSADSPMRLTGIEVISGGSYERII